MELNQPIGRAMQYRKSSIVVSRVGAEELPGAYALIKLNMHRYHEILGIPWRDVWVEDNYKDKENYKITLRGAWKGFLSVEYRPASVFVHTLQIVAQHQGGIYGVAALDWVKAQARERSLPTVECKTFRINPAVALYQKLGFKITAEDAKLYTMALPV